MGPGGCSRMPILRLAFHGNLRSMRRSPAGGCRPLSLVRGRGAPGGLPSMRRGRGKGDRPVSGVRRDLVPGVRGARSRGAPYGRDPMPAVRIPSGLRLPGLRGRSAEHGIGMPGLQPGFPATLPVMRRAPLRGARALPGVRGASPTPCSHRTPPPFLCTFGDPAGCPNSVSHLRNHLSPIGGAVPVLRPAALPPVPCPALAG